MRNVRGTALHRLSIIGQKFKTCSLAERVKQVKVAKLCENCLNSGHEVGACPSQRRCMVCDAKHHTRLHPPSSEASCSFTEGQPAAPSPGTGHITKILGTALVILQAANGKSVSVRALLDPGAEESFVSEHLAQTLSLDKERDNVTI